MEERDLALQANRLIVLLDAAVDLRLVIGQGVFLPIHITARAMGQCLSQVIFFSGQLKRFVGVISGIFEHIIVGVFDRQAGLDARARTIAKRKLVVQLNRLIRLGERVFVLALIAERFGQDGVRERSLWVGRDRFACRSIGIFVAVAQI